MIIAADVTNPYTGQQGAAWQFGRQKGGIDTTLAFLDKQAGKIAQQIKDFWEVDLDDIPGSGAAGGIGGALFLLGAKMVSGFDLVSQITGLEKRSNKQMSSLQEKGGSISKRSTEKFHTV